MHVAINTHVITPCMHIKQYCGIAIIINVCYLHLLRQFNTQKMQQIHQETIRQINNPNMTDIKNQNESSPGVRSLSLSLV